MTLSDSAKAMIEEIKKLGAEKFPICIAKTQYSFSTDAKAYGPTDGFELHVRDITVNMGAEMVYAIDLKSICMPRAFMEVLVQSTGGYQASHVCATNQQFYWVVHL